MAASAVGLVALGRASISMTRKSNHPGPRECFPERRSPSAVTLSDLAAHSKIGTIEVDGACLRGVEWSRGHKKCPRSPRLKSIESRAEECRRNAETCSTAIEKEYWSKMAEEWLRMARDAIPGVNRTRTMIGVRRQIPWECLADPFKSDVASSLDHNHLACNSGAAPKPDPQRLSKKKRPRRGCAQGA